MKKNTLLQPFLFFFILLASLNSFAENTEQIVKNTASEFRMTIKKTTPINSENWNGYKSVDTTIYYTIKTHIGNIGFKSPTTPAVATTAVLQNIHTNTIALFYSFIVYNGTCSNNVLSYNPLVNRNYMIEFNYNISNSAINGGVFYYNWSLDHNNHPSTSINEIFNF